METKTAPAESAGAVLSAEYFCCGRPYWTWNVVDPCAVTPLTAAFETTA